MKAMIFGNLVPVPQGWIREGGSEAPEVCGWGGPETPGVDQWIWGMSEWLHSSCGAPGGASPFADYMENTSI